MRSASGKTPEGSITNCMTSPLGAGSVNVVLVLALACAPLTSDFMPARSRSTTRSPSELLAYLLCDTMVATDARSTSLQWGCASAGTERKSETMPTRLMLLNIFVVFITYVPNISGGAITLEAAVLFSSYRSCCEQRRISQTKST